MSSIGTPKNLNLPPGATDADLLTQAQTLAASDSAAKVQEASTEPQALEALAAMGMMPTTPGGPSKTEANNKFALGALITSQPPPLPADRAPVTPKTQALFESLNNDVSTAMAGTQPPTVGSGAATTNMFTQLASISDAEAQTPEGQQKIQQLVAQGSKAAALDIGNLSSAGMMAAFMILQVQNKASGKEVTATLQDLTADARKESIDTQIAENKAAQQKVQEARAKQKQMGILAPLIEAIMAIATVLASIFTAGSATAVMVTLAVAAIGFLVGGAVGGAQKGNGFDIGSAFTGMAIGGSVGGLLAKAITKLITTLLMRMGTETAMRAGQRLAVEGAKIGTKNLSNKASMIVQGTSLGVQALGTVGQAFLTYRYQSKLADAKEQQAKAKLEKAISDMLQNQFQALSTTLQGMLEMRNTAVNQMIAMLKNQFGVMQKAVSQISA
jgi:uncharacterized membrane protein